MAESFVIGVDLGGTKIYTALAKNNGELLAEVKILTEAAGGLKHVVRRIVHTVEQVKKQSGINNRLACLGIGAPGFLDPEKGTVHQAPNLGWFDVPLKKILEEALHLPVVIDNDANLAALGERIFGAAQGVDDMVYVTVGTGIGGGLVLGGKLYSGTSFSAGEIGHLTIDPDGYLCSCGNRGCLEAHASGTAIVRLARELVERGQGQGIIQVAGGKDKITAQCVSLAAATGDEEALMVLTQTGKSLGIGLANIINLLNPALILLGGGVMQAGKLFWEAMEGEINKRALLVARQQVQVIPAALGQRSGLMGAIALAIQASDIKPFPFEGEGIDESYFRKRSLR